MLSRRGVQISGPLIFDCLRIPSSNPCININCVTECTLNPGSHDELQSDSGLGTTVGTLSTTGTITTTSGTPCREDSMLESSRRTQSLEMLSEPQPSSTKDLSSPVSRDPILTQEVHNIFLSMFIFMCKHYLTL